MKETLHKTAEPGRAAVSSNSCLLSCLFVLIQVWVVGAELLPDPLISVLPPPALTHLVSVSSEAAALHGAGVEVALVVKLEARQARVQLVQDGRQAAPQSQQLRSGAVEANAHGALQGHASPVTQQGAGRKAEDAEEFSRNQTSQTL